MNGTKEKGALSMVQTITEITSANFDAVWKQAAKNLRKVKKKKVTRNLVCAVGSLLFLILSLVSIFSLLYFHGDAEDKVLIDGLPILSTVCRQFGELVLDASYVWYINVLICVGVTYLIPFAASLLIAIIVAILGGGKEAQMPLEGEADRAKGLAHITKEAATLMQFQYKSSVWRILCNWIFTLTICGILLLISYQTKQLSLSVCVGLAAVAVLMHLIYKLLLGISTAINSIFYKFDSSLFNKLSALADAYWVKTDPDEAKRRKEEETRAAAAYADRVAQRISKRKQALSLEADGRYAEAKSLFYQAAQLGDALAMENYARHCLIAGDRSTAIHWMEKCVATGEADSKSRELLKAMKEGRSIDAHYGFD